MCSGVCPGVCTTLNSMLPDGERVAVAQELVVVRSAAELLVEPLVLPVGIPLVRNVHLRADPLRQLARTGDEVRVDVRLGGRHDAQPVGLGQIDVPVDVALGIDDDRLARLLTPDQIRRLGELLVVDHPHEHDVPP